MIRGATAEDVDAIAALAQRTREQYQQYERQFWRISPDAAEVHPLWLGHLIEDEGTVALVAEENGTFAGYAFATVTFVPPVYDPGATATIDDFAVMDDALWPTIGVELVREAQVRLRVLKVAQLVVVCAHRDEAKRSMLQGLGLSLGSEWYVGPVPP
jgi:GNAT superfamily N-acetyltransferase